jgi:16S rRNA G966 N2-methylase RsmD
VRKCYTASEREAYGKMRTMSRNDIKQLALESIEPSLAGYGSIIVNKEKLIQLLSEIDAVNDLTFLKSRVLSVRHILSHPKEDREGIMNIDSNGDTISLRRDVLLSELDQVLEARTPERAKYYLARLENGIRDVRTNKINDINLLRWKEYDDIITDSLWVLGKRDTSGAHLGWYWGNFIPQIPHQMMLRYTKKADWILDTFVGSGTTLIECRKLGRNGIGIELNPEVAQKARELINKEHNTHSVLSEVVVADSRTIDTGHLLENHGADHVELIIMHPPYHDIIKFSEDKNDLSNARTTEEFLRMFGEVVDNATPHLEKGRHLVLVIGDKYSKGEWIPLGFYCMQEVLKRGYLLKSIIVKNFEGTRGKRNQEELWRYRALVGGFYIFKHEYIMLFRKK